MRSCLTFLFCFLVGPLVLPSVALSQEQEDPSQLPEIAPREIEIRGQLQIAFPSLQRQPLHGFSTAPQLPSPPENHRPYVEPYKQELENLPESLPELETASQSLEAAGRDPAQGFLEMGSGRYFTRFAEGRLSVPLSRTETFSVHGDYTGTEGFTAFESPSIQTPSDEAAAQISIESRREVVLLDADVSGEASRYTLYGANPAFTNSVERSPDRDAYSFGTSLRVRTRGSIQSSLQAFYDYTQYSTQFISPEQGTANVFDESRIGARGSITLPVGPFPPRLDADASHSQLSGDVPGSTAFSLDAGGSVPLLSSDALSVRGGARFLTFETPADPTLQSSPTANGSFMSPSVQVEWQVASGAKVHLQNTPTLRKGSLEALYADNPYAEHAPSLRPTLETTNAEAGLTISPGPVRISTSAGYRYAPSFQYFEPGGDSRYTAGIFSVAYESARIIQGSGRIALEGFDPVQISMSLAYRDGELTELETIIPNFAPVVADAMFSYSFADERGLLQLNGHFESERYPTTAQNQALDPFFTVNLEGAYSVSSSFEIVARASNLSVESPTKWPRYPRPPAMLSAGLRIHW